MTNVLQTLSDQQLDQIHQITGDQRYFDEKTGNFTVYFRTQEEADKFTAIVQQFEEENAELITQLMQ
jgi:hypothetical protein